MGMKWRLNESMWNNGDVMYIRHSNRMKVGTSINEDKV